MLTLVKRLLDTGISLPHISAAVQHLRDRSTEDLAQVTLMSDGKSIYEAKSPNNVVNLLVSGQGIFGISLGRLWHEVADKLAEFPAIRAQDGLIPRLTISLLRGGQAAKPTLNRRIKRSTLVRNACLTSNDASRQRHECTRGTGSSSGAGPRLGPRRDPSEAITVTPRKPLVVLFATCDRTCS